MNHGNVQVGSEDSKKANKAVGQAWAKMSYAERRKFQDEAHKIQAARDELKACPFDTVQKEASTKNLRTSQVHRLNHTRLDETLSEVSKHPVWDQGLALGDHISALRGQFVDAVEKDEVAQKSRHFFGYDEEVFANGTLPSFSRSCMWAHSICESEKWYSQACRLVSQIDAGIMSKQLVGRPVLMRLQPSQSSSSCSADSTSTPDRWVILGCMTRKPISHILIHLYLISDTRLGFKVASGTPVLGTMHQLIRDMVASHCAFGAEDSEFDAHVS